MDVVVCVKQIPNPEAPARFEPGSWTLDRSGGLVIDDADTYSVEMALQLVEAHGGGEVTLVSMVPNSEIAGLRFGLAMGASKAVVVSDPGLPGSDALSTAKVLAAAISRLGADLVLCATESTDGYTGTVPVQIAELLGYPSVSFAKRVEIGDGVLKVERQTERGFDDVLCPLPAVVSVTSGVVEPRYPTFKGLMSAKSKPISDLSLVDLDLDQSSVGSVGARQMVISVERAEARPVGVVVVDEGNSEDQIISLLSEWSVI